MTSDDPRGKKLGALVKGTGKQKKKRFPHFLSAVTLIYTTRHALPYLKHKTVRTRRHLWESLDTYRWAGITQSV
jgi:hypothetical protein